MTTKGWKQRTHTRISSKGRKFRAGRSLYVEPSKEILSYDSIPVIKTVFARKALGAEDMYTKENYNERTPIYVYNAPKVYVSEDEFLHILNTLDRLPDHVLGAARDVKTSDRSGSRARAVVIVSSTKRTKLIIDTQGFDYPRYKGWVFK